MIKHYLTFFFINLLLLSSLSAQEKKEFEGLVKYTHKVIAKDSTFDVNYDYSGIGYHSDFYYKNGNYKWLTFDSYFVMDLFLTKEKKNYLLTNNPDTILCLNSTISDGEILDYYIKKAVDTIIGYNCDVLIIKMKPLHKEGPVSYRRYYFSGDFHVDPSHFAGCKGNCYDLIYEQTKSIALRIEFEWPDRTITWEATKIKPMKLEDSFFKLAKKCFINQIN